MILFISQTMVFFFKLNQSLKFFPIMYPSDVCPGPTFVPVRRLYQSDVCKSDICTGPTFVPVRRLCQSYVCTSPTFVPVRRLNCPEFYIIIITSFFYVYLLSSFSPPPSPYSSSSSSLSPFFPGSFVESWVV